MPTLNPFFQRVLVIYAAVNIFVLFLFVMMDPGAAELLTTYFQKEMAPIEDGLPFSSNQIGLDLEDMLKEIMDLHHDILFFLILLFFFVLWILFCLKKKKILS